MDIRSMHEKVKNIYINLMKKQDPDKLEIIFEWPMVAIYTQTPPNIKTYTPKQYVEKLLKELLNESGS